MNAITRNEHEALLKLIDELRKEQGELREELRGQSEELRKNGELTARNTELTAEIAELFQAAKGAFKVLGWIATFVKWAAGVAAATGALWFLFKNGFPPPK